MPSPIDTLHIPQALHTPHTLPKAGAAGAEPGVPPPVFLPSAGVGGTASALPLSSLLPTAPSISQPLPSPQSTHLTLSPQAKIAEALPLATKMPWPVGGVSGPMQNLVATLVQQLTAPTLPQRVVGIQPWPLALAQTLTPTLQTWLVHQGQIQTPEGPRGFSLSLRVPTQWLPQQPSDTSHITNTSTPNTPNTSNTPSFEGKPQALQSGAFALVLQSSGQEASRTSALLILDVQPFLQAPTQAAVYGRDMLQPRQDPWLQMAVLQASGHVPYEDEKAHLGNALCDTPECPYVGRAACVQPFCMTMRSLLPISTTPANVRT